MAIEQPVKHSRTPQSLFQYSSKRQMLIVTFSLLLSFAALIYGVFMPMVSVEKFWIFNNTVSLISSIVTLFETGNFFLGLVIALFSLILPLVKLILLVYIWFYGSLLTSHRWLSWLGRIGKWSMLDVFIVAVMVVVVKLGAIAEVTMHSGIVSFALSVLITKALVVYIHRLDGKVKKVGKKSSKSIDG